MAADKLPVFRLAIVTDLGVPVYDHDFHPATAGRRISTVRTSRRRQVQMLRAAGKCRCCAPHEPCACHLLHPYHSVSSCASIGVYISMSAHEHAIRLQLCRT